MVGITGHLQRIVMSSPWGIAQTGPEFAMLLKLIISVKRLTDSDTIIK
jgi:hypothetical protein